jgi:hypothetical protein
MRPCCRRAEGQKRHGNSDQDGQRSAGNSHGKPPNGRPNMGLPAFTSSYIGDIRRSRGRTATGLRPPLRSILRYLPGSLQGSGRSCCLGGQGTDP